MAYQVEMNRHTGKARLNYVATVHRENIGPPHSFKRRLTMRNGRVYHVTKGYRVDRDLKSA